MLLFIIIIIIISSSSSTVRIIIVFILCLSLMELPYLHYAVSVIGLVAVDSAH
jgi:hypothetical protein